LQIRCCKPKQRVSLRLRIVVQDTDEHQKQKAPFLQYAHKESLVSSNL